MSGSSRTSADVLLGLQRDGYSFVPRWRGELETLEVAKSLGNVLDIQKLLPRSGIPTVQTLKPRREKEAPGNQYSTEFGLGTFPLHTDLAHWALPPRYFILRCKSGAAAVRTSLLPAAAIISTVGTSVLKRALVRPRHAVAGGVQCLLPLLFGQTVRRSLRWDPIFVKPMNQAAQLVARVMSTNAWDRSYLLEVALSDPGDTLLVDNWRFLHGRSSVPDTDIHRHIERVYLSEVNV